MLVSNARRAAVLLLCSAQALVLAQEPAPATAPAPVPPAAATTAPASAASPMAAPTSTARPYAEVVRGASHSPGFLSLYQKDEKVWIELLPEQFDRPLFMTVNLSHGIGERGIYGSQMGPSQVVVFHRVGNLVQLIAKNTSYGASAGRPQALAVAQAYSDSLLAIAPVASAPHPNNRAVLVEANVLLFSDIPGFGTRLETAFRLPYGMDARNSSFLNVRADPSMTGLHVNAHFYVGRIPAPPLALPGVPAATSAASSALAVSPPTTLPDPRSLFLGFYYSFLPLPAQPMSGRVADDRLGHFVSTRHDFSDDLKPTTAVHLIERWRLEKQDPALPLSEPKQPIVYWLDANIPEQYRASVRQGVLAWNQAFERIGFRNAIVVKQQTAQDNFDTMDGRHASVRWFVGSDVAFAAGPRQVDPRSGEILDADIAISDAFARGARRLAGEDGLVTMAEQPAHCEYLQQSGAEMGFALDLLEARSELDMASPQAEALAQAYVRSVVMHEVGHTLGLRHNFRASTIYSLAQLQDPAFTRQHGLAGSVMDYTPFNLALKGEPQGEYVASALGPYDYWAIEYAYQTMAAEQEAATLAQIAARSNQPQLAFGSDQDVGGYNADPEVNAFDLGSDPLAYFQRRLTLSRELWDRLQHRTLKPGQSYEVLRRSFDDGFQQFARTVPLLLKYVGGMTSLRDHAGTGRATFTPVPLARQRLALQMLTTSLFRPNSFQFAPALISRLGPDHFEPRGRTDVSVGARVLALQAAALDQLLSDAVAARMLDAQEKLEDRRQAYSLDELYRTLQQAVWSELKTGSDIIAMRRNVQREHLKRVTAQLLRSSPSTPADARSLQREHALALQAALRAALATASTRSLSREARAHLSESYETVSQALKASMFRAGA